jgi:hypothetical protein
MEESIRFERMDALNITEVQAQPIRPTLATLRKNQDSFFAGPQHLSFESLMDLNHLNNFQLFLPFILFAVTSL